jgi:DNA gyrase inhibitor GyrI/DNA-binding transcriptional ArsR family regulator
MDEQPFESKRAMRLFIQESLDDISGLLRALNHPKRIEMLALLLEEPKKFKTLVEEIQIQKSGLSNHLSVLIDKKLVKKADRGIYKLTEDGEDLLSNITQSYLGVKIREQERLSQVRKIIGRYTVYFEDESMSKEVRSAMSKGKKIDIRIVKLESMRVASAHAIGKSPEPIAHEKLMRWAEKKGFFEGTQEEHPVFGFNNPDPSSDKEEYGYEFWIRVGSEIQSEDEIKVKDFEGGLYAVTTTKLISNDENMIPAWKQLADWVNNHDKYKMEKRIFLEHHLNPRAAPEDLVLDLYCPIEEK